MAIKKHRLTWQSIWIPYLTVFVIWFIYRAFFHFSLLTEELFIKGIIFCLPLWLFPLDQKNQTMGIVTVKFFKSVYLGILIGLILGLVGQLGNFIRHGSFLFSSYGLTSGKMGGFIILALITATWEQLLFTGYFLAKISEITKNESTQIILTGILFSLIHLPAYIFIHQLIWSQLILGLCLLLILGMGCAILKLRLNNLIAPIMAHAIWGITVFLFR